jgi:thioredoxin 1
MAEIQELTDGNFNEAINEGITLVDFWAKWCGPCKILEPVIKSVANKMGDSVKVAKVDVDHAQETTAQFEITLIPTLIVFNKGVPVRQFVGFVSETEIMNAINETRQTVER